MNRPIKFRAWDGKRMLFSESGDFYLMPNNKADIPSSTGHEFYRKDYPVMQFTGLHDKNGREIYEGDIVKQENYSIHLKVVWNSLGRFCLEFEDGKHNDFIPHPMVEIIGNIYQHNHLLNHD